MKNTKCPERKTCFGYMDNACEGCDIGEEITRLHKRIDRLKKQNETLTIQCNAWTLAAKAVAESHKWISVEDEMPERNGRYLTHCLIEGQSLVCILYYSKIGGFNESTITHWMPLPEPPKEREKGE